MWLFKSIILLYLCAAFAAQDPGEERPVPVVHLQSHWSEVYPSEQVKLRCDLNDEAWGVTWSKDQQEIQTASMSVTLTEESRVLTVKAESQTQSGKYSCRGVHKTNTSLSTEESNALPITVHGQKLTPALRVSGSTQDIFVGESVTFRCSVNITSGGEYHWFLNDYHVHKSFEDEYKVLSAEETNNGNYQCKVQRGGVSVSTDSNTVSIKVSDVPRPTVKLLSPWLDVIEKEQVLLQCETVGPDWSFTWFREGEIITDSPHGRMSGDGGARLTLPSVSQSVQGLYTCSAHHNTKHVKSGQSKPLKITVHDTPTPTLSKSPHLKKMYEGDTATFTCAVDVSTNWTYTWYKDDAETSHTGPTLSIRLGQSDAGKYSCRAHRHGVETHTSDKMTLAVDGVPVPSVILLSSWPDVFVNEMVNLTCQSDSTEWTFSWLKSGQPVSADASVSITDQGANLHIMSASRNHMGHYTCKAHHKTRDVHSEPSLPLDLTVYENTPKPTLSQIDPEFNPMYVGETARFDCRVGLGAGWKFMWFKDGSKTHFTEPRISLPLSLSDSGKYACKGTRGGRTTTGSSDEISLTVLEAPAPQLKALTPWQDVFPSETVELGCRASSAPSDWTYEWYKDEKKIPRNSNSVTLDSDGANLTISSAASSHRGQYKCEATLKSRRVITSSSNGLTLKVYDKKPQPVLIQDLDYSILFPKEPLSLRCHINISDGWKFMWYKDKEPLPELNLDEYKVTSPDTTHTGSYTCEARRGERHIFSSDLSEEKNVEIREDIPEPVLSRTPDVDKVYVGEQLVLKCDLDVSADWEYYWYRGGQMMDQNVSSIVINATHPHSEAYRCKAKRRTTLFETMSQPKVFHVFAIPTPSVKSEYEWQDVFPGETVMLRCGMETEASDWSYTWNKDTRLIQSEESVRSDGDGTVLTIISSGSHAGEYSCMATHKNRPVFSNFSSEIGLQVYDAKPSVQLVQDPEISVFHTEDSVFFHCGVNVSSGWEYSWHKNEVHLASGPNYTIGHLDTPHSGQYRCRARRGQGETVFYTESSRSLSMEVHERPSATIVLLTGWSEVFSTDSLWLKCEAQDSENDWEFKWFKAGKEIPEALSNTHEITPQNDPDQSKYTCQGVRSGRPAYTKRSEALETKNLLLKRRVLLSISGCLVFGICAVFFGCILLRVFRKKAADQEKPEEADLFLTMAELAKHAPNPLAEYVTDEDIKDIAKEPTEKDENGTLCSESTPLPLTSKDDEATPSQSNNTSGNGEMVSFKQ